MCKVLKVDRSSYYHWVKMGCIEKRVDKQLNELIKKIFIDSRQTYGTRRIKKVLFKSFDVKASRRHMGKIMKDLNLVDNAPNFV